MVIAPFGILTGLLLLGLLVAGVVMAVVLLRGKRMGWLWGVAAAVVAVLVVLAGAYSFVGVRRPRDVGSTVQVAQSVQRVYRTERPAPSRIETSGFQADVYPSAAQAVRAVAEQLASSAERFFGAGPPPTLFVTGQAPPELLSLAAERFGKLTLARKAEVTAATRPAGGNDLLCAVRVDAGKQGTVQLALSGPKGQVTRTARFVDKPWAANFAQYLAGASGKHALAESRGLSPEFAEADRSALDAAAAQVLILVRQAIDRGIAAGQFPPTARAGDEALRPLIAGELARGEMIADRFPQRFRRPYADVWKQSLLIDCSAEKVDRLAGAVCAQTAGRRRVAESTWARLAMSIGGLGVLILAVYLVLNAATKGYYVWVLRVAAIVGLMAAVVGVYLWMRMDML